MESAKSEVALRCAKAAVLLSTLRDCCPNPTESKFEFQDGEEIRELKKELVKEKLKNKKMRMFSLAELLVLTVVLLSLLTLSVFIAFDVLEI